MGGNMIFSAIISDGWLEFVPKIKVTHAHPLNASHSVRQSVFHAARGSEILQGM